MAVGAACKADRKSKNTLTAFSASWSFCMSGRSLAIIVHPVCVGTRMHPLLCNPAWQGLPHSSKHVAAQQGHQKTWKLVSSACSWPLLNMMLLSSAWPS